MNLCWLGWLRERYFRSEEGGVLVMMGLGCSCICEVNCVEGVGESILEV